MRKRTLSDEGLHLYLNATADSRPRRWYKRLLCTLFHTDYDERLDDVVWKCRESTKALCADFNNPRLADHLEAAVHNTIQLILLGPTSRQREKDFRFFCRRDAPRFSRARPPDRTHALHFANTPDGRATVRKKQGLA